jgi:hypothetical protein
MPTIRTALEAELINRKVQLDRLKEHVEGGTDADNWLRKARVSFAGAEGKIATGQFSDAVYLFSQGCWNAGAAFVAAKQNEEG